MIVICAHFARINSLNKFQMSNQHDRIGRSLRFCCSGLSWWGFSLFLFHTGTIKIVVSRLAINSIAIWYDLSSGFSSELGSFF